MHLVLDGGGDWLLGGGGGNNGSLISFMARNLVVGDTGIK